MSSSRVLWTIGHWTCPVPVFMEPLRESRIDLIVDVRAHPGSRRNPQFGRDEMAGWLAEDGIEYRHVPELGGRRGRQDVDPAVNAGWQNQSFKNYADYTLTSDYEAGIRQLTDLARSHRVAVMCGEPMPWRCHRLLIANTLVARGWSVWHLMNGSDPREHQLGQWGATPVADDERRLTYPE